MMTNKTRMILLLRDFGCFLFTGVLAFGAGFLASLQPVDLNKSAGFWGTIYRPQITLVLLGTVLYFGAFAVIWHLLLRDELLRLSGSHRGWYAAWFFLALLGLFGVFIGALFGYICHCGLFDAMKGTGAFIAAIMAFTVLYPIAVCLLSRKKKGNTNVSEHIEN